ncbi:hypothetical protein TWF506_000594, partial [Arthrobotrys conoides]
VSIMEIPKGRDSPYSFRRARRSANYNISSGYPTQSWFRTALTPLSLEFER